MELAVRCQNLQKRYGDVVAVDGLSFEVRRGECYGLLGPNGAGKTTTIEILEGLLSPDGGDVEVLGCRWKTDERQLRQRLGVQLQETQFTDKLTVEETLRLFRSFYHRGKTDRRTARARRTRKQASQLGRQAVRRTEAAALDRVRARRAIRICCSWTSPRPDWIRSRAVSSGASSTRFREAGGTVVLTTHYMDEAETLCDRVAIVDHGRVIARGHAEGH